VNHPILDYETPHSPACRSAVRVALMRVIVGTVAVVLSAIAGQFIPPLWEGIGRDWSPAATNSAILILLLSILLRGWLRWSILQFVLILLAVEGITLLIISLFSGLFLLDPFNLSWLGQISVFIAGPWLAGLVLGSVVLYVRQGDGNKAK
jgi:hypothetical protein